VSKAESNHVRRVADCDDDLPLRPGVNQKGGIGKTTTAVNLAAALGEKGRRVLVVDLDPQASATGWYGVKDAGRGLQEVFTDGRTWPPWSRQTEAPVSPPGPRGAV
jgi:Mrp family chromosome partitioning ATPase